MTALLRDRRFILSSLFLLVTAAYFWGGSRYPSLNAKAEMGGDSGLEDPLGFESLFDLENSVSFLHTVGLTTLNWISTNQQGMTFGLLFAAGFMTLFSLIQRTQFKSRWANAWMGLLIGTPLGVCVNCAAPVARGMHQSGMRAETFVATMLSSPSFNVVVLTMMFSLLPAYMVVTKIALTLVLVLLIVPLLCRWLLDNSETLSLKDAGGMQCTTELYPSGGDKTELVSWWQALIWFAKEYVKNFLFIVKKTVPLMLLAGFLGALVITLLPWEQLMQVLPTRGYLWIMLAMAGVALLGAFLPVPIAFDVIVVATLVLAGLDEKYAAILLFTLGVFSVYSFSIVWQSLGWRFAAVLYGVVVGLGLSSGVIAHYYDKWVSQRLADEAFSQIEVLGQAERPVPVLTQGEDYASVQRQVQKYQQAWQLHEALPASNISVYRRSFLADTKRPSASVFFESVDGRKVGIDALPRPDFLRARVLPYMQLGGVAAGDVNNDGWVDLLISQNGYLGLYINIGGERFIKQHLPHLDKDQSRLFNAAFADLNSDGWLDMVTSSYYGHLAIHYNELGNFLTPVLLPSTGASYASALAFGDIDRDGDIDMVQGSYSLGLHYLSVKSATNHIWENQDGRFVAHPLPGMPGETLSTLLSDIDKDGDLDLLVGNDFAVSDILYRNTGVPGQIRFEQDFDIFPYTTTTTMNVDSVDIDNDLIPEVFFAQITGQGLSSDVPKQNLDEYCSYISDENDRALCIENSTHSDTRKMASSNGLQHCLSLPNLYDKGDCMALWVHQKVYSMGGRQLERCIQLPSPWGEQAERCKQVARSEHSVVKAEELTPKQITGHHLLWSASSPKNAYRDVTEKAGLLQTGWTWNVRFADANFDGWQDAYFVTGPGQNNRVLNGFYENNRLGQFEERAETFGLTNFANATGSTFVDIDNDGDLDLVMIPTMEPVTLFKNQGVQNHAAAIQLDDKKNNRYGVGAKVIAHYGDGQVQYRELKTSGGYLSFDAPVLWFGLGGHPQIDKLEITWPDGATQVYERPLTAGAYYRVVREL